MMISYFIRFVALLAIASAPVCIGTIGWGLILIFEQVPGWIFLAQCLSFVFIALGIASQIDNQEQRQNHQERDR